MLSFFTLQLYCSAGNRARKGDFSAFIMTQKRVEDIKLLHLFDGLVAMFCNYILTKNILLVRFCCIFRGTEFVWVFFLLQRREKIYDPEFQVIDHNGNMRIAEGCT